MPKLRGSVAQELNRQIVDPRLRAALSAVLLYTGLPARHTPAFQMVGLAALLADEFYMPAGGMGRIPEVLAKALRERDGDIVLNADVRRIDVQSGRVRGLELDGDRRIEADAMVCAASAMSTFGALLDPSVVPDKMKRKAATTVLSRSALSLQLGLANRIDTPANFVNRVPLMDRQHRLLAGTHGPPEWFSYSVPTVTLPELAPPGGSIVERCFRQSMRTCRWTYGIGPSMMSGIFAADALVRRFAAQPA